MNGRMAFSIAVMVAALVAVAVVAGPDLFGGDDDGGGKPAAQTTPTATTDELGTSTPEIVKRKDKPKVTPLPQNPDDLKGSDPRSLTRAANLKRALAVLEPLRQRREAIFDGLRVSPGRVDTTIDSAERKLTLQVRPDMKISFRVDHEFPNASNPRWRQYGISAREVDVTVPQRMLRNIAKTRGASTADDIDYFVIRRDIIDHHVGYGAYFKRGPQPRIVILERDGKLRPLN